MSRMNRCEGNAGRGRATILLKSGPDRERETPFGQLVRLVRSNQHLSDRLAALRVQQREACRYLERPGANLALGAAVCERLARQRAAVRAQLQANRIEAEAWLSPCAEPEARQRRLA